LGKFGIKKLANCDTPIIDLIGDELKLVPASRYIDIKHSIALRFKFQPLPERKDLKFLVFFGAFHERTVHLGQRNMKI